MSQIAYSVKRRDDRFTEAPQLLHAATDDQLRHTQIAVRLDLLDSRLWRWPKMIGWPNAGILLHFLGADEVRWVFGKIKLRLGVQLDVVRRASVLGARASQRADH